MLKIKHVIYLYKITNYNTISNHAYISFYELFILKKHFIFEICLSKIIFKFFGIIEVI